MAQIHVSRLTIELAGAVVVDGVTFTAAGRDRIGLVGPNGVGKSTLLRALASEIEPRAGSIETVPAEATVGLLNQEFDANDETVLEYVARRVGVAQASARLDQATERLAEGTAEAIEEHASALDRWLRLGGSDFETRLEVALDNVGFKASTTSGKRALQPAARLSGGEGARVGLAALQVARHDVLLLDEPTNNLDQAGLRELEQVVAAADVPIVVVSHDRRFLERTVTSVLELDGHSRAATLYNETWAGYLEARDVARRHEAARYQDYQVERSRLKDRAQQQRQWAQKGVRAERRPVDNDKIAKGARIDRTEKQAAKARQTERALDRLTVVDKPWEPWRLQFAIGRAERSGDLVAELDSAVVQRGDFRLGPVSVTVAAGERVVIRGGNGDGKTTIIRALLGEIALQSGHQRLGRSVKIGRLDQTRHQLSEGDVVDRFVSETGVVPEEARNVLAKFGLGAEHLQRPASQWSPGERTRAGLAVFAATGVNTLVLDEPTNHLDLPAIEQLESAIDRFEGTLLLVTHDRAFLDAVRHTRSLELVDGQVVLDEAR